MIIELKCWESAVRESIYEPCALFVNSVKALLRERKESELTAWCVLVICASFSPKVSVFLSAAFLLIRPPHWVSRPASPIITLLWSPGRAAEMYFGSYSLQITFVALRCRSEWTRWIRGEECVGTSELNKLLFGWSHWQVF